MMIGEPSTRPGFLRDGLSVVLECDIESITGLRELTAGAHRESWAFDVMGLDRPEPLILRLGSQNHESQIIPGGFRDSALGASIERDVRMFEAAAAAEVPEPRIVAWSNDDSLLGADFLIAERIDGETIGQRIVHGEWIAPARPLLAAKCGEILAKIHSIDLKTLPALERPDPLAKLVGVLDAFADPSPAFELAVRWMADHRPASTAETVVHGDFRVGNLIIGPDGIRAVLDWENVHAGDPIEDLAWLCVRAWRYGAYDKPVGGFGEYHELVRAYEAAGGIKVEPQVLHWWELFGVLKWGVSCLEQAWRHTSGAESGLEWLAIANRIYEAEYDALLLIEDGPKCW
jgi:aminoglycoside phosphotransferase (APT) family kinase protein